MTDETAAPQSDRQVRLAMIGLLLGLLLAMLDNFIVGTAVPSIVKDLDGAELLAWIVTAYALTTAVSTPIWGKLGDLFGRKRTFQISVVLFIIGSVAAAAAPTMEALIALRALQGVGAGGLAVGAFAVIGDLVPPRERGRYQGLVATVVAAGTIGGPVLGGLLTDTLGWRWAFLINLPLGIATVVWVALTLHIPRVRRRALIDWAGAILLAIFVGALILWASWAGHEFPWVSLQTGAFLALAACSVAGFILRERRAPEPIIPLRIFASRSFTMASVLAFSSGAITFACVLYLPLFQQIVQGVSPSASGLLLLPMVIPVIIVSQVAGRVMTRTGRYKVFPVIGALSSTVGAILLATMSTGTPVWITSMFMVFMGIGTGLTQQMTTTIAQNAVDQNTIGAASGAVTLFRILGGAIAVAVFSSVYTTHTLTNGLVDTRVGISDAIGNIFLIVAAVGAVALIAAAAIKEVPLRGRPAIAPAAEPQNTGPSAA